MDAVSLRHVIKTYRRGRESVEVLHRLDLTVPEGEFLALMGPSGSGKTTILNLIGGLDHADSGEVIVAGEHLEALSGGQQQRVGIARAIVTDPSILLCDEPTGDLDRQSADDILHLLQQLNRQQKKTIIMVTHDQKAADYASRTLHVDKGALAERELA